MIIIIAAMDKNRLIGVDNKMPWNVPLEMKHFRTTTSGHTVLMGRNTFESIGKPLPKRKNVILTSRPFPLEYDVEVITDLEAYLLAWPNTKTLFVMGGAKVYKAALPYADKLIISVVKGDYTGDTYFPPLPHDFALVKEEDYDDFFVYHYEHINE